MENKIKVVVIGAGIIGLSIAYNLALLGADVTVLDKKEPGSGCTQAAFAMLIAAHPDGPEHFNSLYGAAILEWHRLETQLKESLPIQWGGVVNWTEPGMAENELITTSERLIRWGVNVKILEEGDIPRLVPGVTPGKVGAGIFLPDQGAVDIKLMFPILVRHAINAGVKFETPVEVTGMSKGRSGKPPLLVTSNGIFEADKLVISAGEDTPRLAEMLTGTHIPISLASGTLAYSKPVDQILGRVLIGPLGSIKQNPDGTIVCGPDYRPGANGQDTSDAYGQMLLESAANVVPALAGLQLDEMRGGHVPIPKDHLPIIGFCDTSRSQIYVATMMSGITMAPLIGRLAASEILGTPCTLLGRYRPQRFIQPEKIKPSLLIVGGGAFGISTAWHLACSAKNYSNIRVLDRCPPPSKLAAATDINKIIRTEYSDPVYSQLAEEAMHKWTDPNSIFEKHFHPSGWLLSASGASVPFIQESARKAKERGLDEVKLMTITEVKSKWPVLSGKMNGWKILSSPAAGWAAAGEILYEMAMESSQKGISFISGDSGDVQKLLFNQAGACTGVLAADGTTHRADCVILATGANTARLLDLENQQNALGHTVCCIQLTRDEAQMFENMPVFANIEEGCIFPPDKNHVVKIASVHMVTNFRSTKVSLPRFLEDYPGEDVPQGIQRRLRNWLREACPLLADKPWTEKRICWDAETRNEDFIITKHPRHKGLVVATGGSGHAFKFLPTLGEFVMQALEDALPEHLAKKWQWTPFSTATAGSTSMFTSTAQELSDMSDHLRREVDVAKL